MLFSFFSQQLHTGRPFFSLDDFICHIEDPVLLHPAAGHDIGKHVIVVEGFFEHLLLFGQGGRFEKIAWFRR